MGAKRGAPRGPRGLPDDVVSQIYALVDEGRSVSAIVRETGVPKHRVYRTIWRRRDAREGGQPDPRGESLAQVARHGGAMAALGRDAPADAPSTDIADDVRAYLLDTIRSQMALCRQLDARLAVVVLDDRQIGSEVKNLELSRGIAQDKICAARRDLKALDIEKPNEVVYLPTPRSYTKPPRP
jgi:hypothetical protein